MGARFRARNVPTMERIPRRNCARTLKRTLQRRIMPTDDRERNFEKAMARELRADALNGLHCPDAETLAAYHERLLSPEEMAAQKSHIASCERCQEVLATLETTEAVSSEKERDAVAVTAQKTMSAVAPAPVFSRPEEATRKQSSSVREMPKPRPYLRWAVPAGAIAAGLLVWVAINFNSSQRKAATQHSPSAAVEIAENREQKDAQFAAPRSDIAAPTAKAESAVKSDADLKQTPAHEYDKALGDRLDKSARTRSGAAANLPHGPRVLQNQAQNQIRNNANANDAFTGRQNQTGVGNGAGTGADFGVAGGALSGAASAAPTTLPAPAPKRAAEAKKEAPAPPPPPTTTQASADGNIPKGMTETVEVTGAAPIVEAESAAKEKKTLDTGAQTQQLARNETQMLQIRGRDVHDLGVAIVWTPDQKVYWLVLADGSLRKTEDGGQSNVVQSPGKGIKVIAGVATDAKTCWVLAQGNLVFRTTDGGKHWKKVSEPSGGDFKTITATDKQRATVADATGAVKLGTTDGGATWAPVQP